MADLKVEEARAEKARLIQLVRDQFNHGCPNISDERIWEAWRETTKKMANLPEDLKRFNPRGTASPPMVAMQLLMDVIEGRL